jgi:hypothetical protein
LKRILLMLLIGCLLTIFGCSNAPVKSDKNVSVNEPQVSGKYVLGAASIIFIELKNDGSFNHQFGKRHSYGKYVIDGNRVILKYENGITYELIFEGKSLTDKEGGRFTKQ